MRILRFSKRPTPTLLEEGQLSAVEPGSGIKEFPQSL